MRTYNRTKIIKSILDSRYLLFSAAVLKNITGITSSSTIHRIIQDLVSGEIIRKLERDKYYINDSRLDDYAKANIFYSPSYVSFETALSLHGILSQIPYEMTNATPKKSKTKIVEGKTFSYTHLKKSLFWGYQKQGNSLIAEPEKALLDQLYLHSKGLKGQSIDEYDYERLDLKKFWSYAKMFPQTKTFKALLVRLKLELKNPHHYDVI